MPGLVYVAHHRDGLGDPAWFMDEDYASDGTCAAWGDPDAVLANLAHPRFCDVSDKTRCCSRGTTGPGRTSRATIGAVAKVTDSLGVARLRQVAGSTGQGDQDSLTLHLGLGAADRVTRIVLASPGGHTTVFDEALDADQRLTLWQSGALTAGLAPRAIRERTW